MRISDWSSDVCSSDLTPHKLTQRDIIMTWLQENGIVALVVLIVVIALLWWLLARRKPQEIAPPTVEPAPPAKPLEPAKPDIVAAEPAFRKAATPPPAPAPMPTPVAETPPPAAAPPPAEPAPPRPAPAADKADNLQLLKGVGPKLVTLLQGLGVTRFEQIAGWTDADLAAIDPQPGNFSGDRKSTRLTSRTQCAN